MLLEQVRTSRVHKRSNPLVIVQRPHAWQSERMPTAAAERFLRDVAFALHATRSVKQSMLATKPV